MTLNITEWLVLSQYACGCQIREFKRGEKGYRIKDVVIEYCPKHKAAPAMYEALKLAETAIHNSIRYEAAGDYRKQLQQYLRQIQEALSKIKEEL